jgi:hypothetical protein
MIMTNLDRLIESLKQAGKMGIDTKRLWAQLQEPLGVPLFHLTRWELDVVYSANACGWIEVRVQNKWQSGRHVDVRHDDGRVVRLKDKALVMPSLDEPKKAKPELVWLKADEQGYITLDTVNVGRRTLRVDHANQAGTIEETLDNHPDGPLRFWRWWYRMRDGKRVTVATPFLARDHDGFVAPGICNEEFLQDDEASPMFPDGIVCIKEDDHR